MAINYSNSLNKQITPKAQLTSVNPIVKTTATQPTNATTQNGGKNSANEQKYLTGLYNSGNAGQKSWASQEAKKYGFSLGGTPSASIKPIGTPTPTTQPSSSGNNQQKYLQSLISTGNPGQKAWAQKELAKMSGTTPTSNGLVPTSYDQLQTPQQLMNYANNQAQNKFDNEALGYNQQIDRYEQLIGQQLNDQQITNKAQNFGDLKYAQSRVELENEMRNAQLEEELGRREIGRNYESSLKSLQDLANGQRADARNNLAARGLYNSSILDQRTAMIDQAGMEGRTELEKQVNQNIADLDAEMNTLMANISARGTSLTQQQQSEVGQYLQELMKERDDQVANYNLMIDQQNQGINQARNNQSSYADSLYQDLYGRNRGFYSDDRAYGEDKRRYEQDRIEDIRRWNLDYELKKKVGSGGGGYGGWGGYSRGGYNSPSSTTKPSTAYSPTGSYSRSVADSAAKSNKQSTPTQRQSLGMGPISDAYYKQITNDISKKNDISQFTPYASALQPKKPASKPKDSSKPDPLKDLKKVPTSSKGGSSKKK